MDKSKDAPIPEKTAVPKQKEAALPDRKSTPDPTFVRGTIDPPTKK